jgi:hypothetical protein
MRLTLLASSERCGTLRTKYPYWVRVSRSAKRPLYESQFQRTGGGRRACLTARDRLLEIVGFIDGERFDVAEPRGGPRRWRGVEQRDERGNARCGGFSGFVDADRRERGRPGSWCGDF